MNKSLACIYDEEKKEVLNVGHYERVHNTFVNKINTLEMNHLKNNQFKFIVFKDFFKGYVKDDKAANEVAAIIIYLTLENETYFSQVYDLIENKNMSIEDKKGELMTLIVLGLNKTGLLKESYHE